MGVGNEGLVRDARVEVHLAHDVRRACHLPRGGTRARASAASRGSTTRGVHDRLGAVRRAFTHLRDPLGADEAADLDGAHAGAREPVDELDLRRGRDDRLFVLQPVARADLYDLDEVAASGVGGGVVHCVRGEARSVPAQWAAVVRDDLDGACGAGPEWYHRGCGCDDAALEGYLDGSLGVPDEERGLITSCQGRRGAHSASRSCADGPRLSSAARDFRFSPSRRSASQVRLQLIGVSLCTACTKSAYTQNRTCAAIPLIERDRFCD